MDDVTSSKIDSLYGLQNETSKMSLEGTRANQEKTQNDHQDT